MNIFILDLIAKICAIYHCDKHVVKMIIETAQLLSSAHHILDGEEAIEYLYKSTHKNHPCAIWTRECSSNYIWLYNLFIELCNEYTFRYKKTHLTDTKLRNILKQLPKNIPNGELTNFALAMPDEYKFPENAVESYRNYYINEKSKMFVWTGRERPKWAV